MHKYINNKDMWESVEIEMKRYFEDSFFLDGEGEYRDLTGEVIKRNVMRKMMYRHYTLLVHGHLGKGCRVKIPDCVLKGIRGN